MLGLGSSASLGIGLAVYLDDKFTNPSRRMTAQVNAMGMSVNQFAGHVRTLELFAAGVFLGVKALTAFSKFDKTMSAAGIIGGFEKGTDEYKKLTAQTLEMSKIYGQLPQELALTNLELAKAGKSVPEIMQLTDAVTALGAATDTKVGGAGGAAEMLVNTMQAFNASNDEAMRFADIMTSAANRSTIDVTDLAESLKYSSDVARSLSIPFEDAAVAIATLGNAGLKGSMAGVAYANMLRYISTGITKWGTKKQQKALASLGLTGNDFRDANGNLKNLGGILDILRDKTADLSDPDKMGVLTAIFGVRGARGLVPLMAGMKTDENGKRVSTFEDMDRAIKGDKGTAKETALKRIDNLAGDFNKLMASWERLLISDGSKLEAIARPIIQLLITAMDWLASASSSGIGSALLKSGTIWLMILRPLRAAFAIFGPRIIGAGFSLKNSMGTSAGISEVIARNIMRAGDYLVMKMLKAQGIALMGPGGSTLMGRGPGGRLTGGLGKATWLTKGLGAIFGRRGLRWAVQAGRFFESLLMGSGVISKVLRWFIKGGGWIKALGGVLGKVIGWLFGWEAMLVDLGLTMLTGKGLFEWLWVGVKWLWEKVMWLGGVFSSIGDWWNNLGEPDKQFSSPALSDKQAVEDYWNQKNNAKMNYQKELGSHTTNIPIHVTVNPTTGDKRTEHYINKNAERSLNGAGINLNAY